MATTSISSMIKAGLAKRGSLGLTTKAGGQPVATTPPAYVPNPNTGTRPFMRDGVFDTEAFYQSLSPGERQTIVERHRVAPPHKVVMIPSASISARC